VVDHHQVIKPAPVFTVGILARVSSDLSRPPSRSRLLLAACRGTGRAGCPLPISKRGLATPQCILASHGYTEPSPQVIRAVQQVDDCDDRDSADASSRCRSDSHLSTTEAPVFNGPPEQSSCEQGQTGGISEHGAILASSQCESSQDDGGGGAWSVRHYVARQVSIATFIQSKAEMRAFWRVGRVELGPKVEVFKGSRAKSRGFLGIRGAIPRIPEGLNENTYGIAVVPEFAESVFLICPASISRAFRGCKGSAPFGVAGWWCAGPDRERLTVRPAVQVPSWQGCSPALDVLAVRHLGVRVAVEIAAGVAG
jgi:hypothetical protein